jgi:hypothetical protein
MRSSNTAMDLPEELPDGSGSQCSVDNRNKLACGD